jgi:hypothetical protein
MTVKAGRYNQTFEALRARSEAARQAFAENTATRRAALAELVSIDEQGCWLWTGYINNKGYGRWAAFYVHRLLWSLRHGAVPAGLELDHLCRNRRCVNPEHLVAVTHAENMRRAPRSGPVPHPEHCPQGHPWAVHAVANSKGYRECRACQVKSKRAYADRQKAMA